NRIGYPVLVRPSFVLGGRGMELVYNEPDLRRYVAAAIDLGSARVPRAVSDILSDTLEEAPQNAEPSAQDVRAARPMLIDRVLEVNPRASRTVPFVSKAIGVPLAKLAAKVMAGKTLSELGFIKEIVPKHFSVKEAVFPFLRYQGQDISLGPEMKSTGEVMGIDHDLGLAYAKS